MTELSEFQVGQRVYIDDAIGGTLRAYVVNVQAEGAFAGFIQCGWTYAGEARDWWFQPFRLTLITPAMDIIEGEAKEAAYIRENWPGP